jgi:NADPH2:quinone reductase
MRALVCQTFGEPETLVIGELPDPVPAKGEVLIDVAAAGVSFADTLMIRDLHQNKHTLPFAAGMEVAGRIKALGDGVEGLAIGDRVMALVYDGGYAEQAVAPAPETFRIPDTMDYATAAAMCAAYLTSHGALVWQGAVQAGDMVLVLGAAGGVGLAAVEVAKAIGATVIAAASSPEKLAVAAAHGADHCINYLDQDLRSQALALTGGNGVNIVYDPVAGDLYEPAFRSLDWGGRYLTIGYAGGAIPKIPANQLLVKNRSAIGFALFYYRKRRPDLLAKSASALTHWFLEGHIRPQVTERYSLDDGRIALRRIMNRDAKGRLVLEIASL